MEKFKRVADEKFMWGHDAGARIGSHEILTLPRLKFNAIDAGMECRRRRCRSRRCSPGLTQLSWRVFLLFRAKMYTAG